MLQRSVGMARWHTAGLVPGAGRAQKLWHTQSSVSYSSEITESVERPRKGDVLELECTDLAYGRGDVRGGILLACDSYKKILMNSSADEYHFSTATVTSLFYFMLRVFANLKAASLFLCPKVFRGRDSQLKSQYPRRATPELTK